MHNGELRYVIDTCSLTQLRRVYPHDVYPFQAVWDKVGDLADRGILISIEDVYEELKVQDDEVFDWAKKYSHMFLPLDAIVQTKASQVLREHPNLIDLKKKKSSADPFIIATALLYSCTVVTEERMSDSLRVSKIPDVCKAYKIGCIKLLELLRRDNPRATQM
ncbi:MAG: hypothetical protein DDT33_00918 [Firmicutes bacterium]|nr:hypothetical protein [Bacillota bacterium]